MKIFKAAIALILSSITLQSQIQSHGFVAGTLVYQAGQLIDISSLYRHGTAGIPIECCLETTLKEAHHTLLCVNKSEVFHTIQIVVADDDRTLVECSPHQPFYSVTRQQWVPAYDLTVHDQLYCRQGTTLGITRISHLYTPTTIYALSVDRAHTYFVTRHRILVHNAAAALTPGLQFLMTIGCALGIIGKSASMNAITTGATTGTGAALATGTAIVKQEVVKETVKEVVKQVVQQGASTVSKAASSSPTLQSMFQSVASKSLEYIPQYPAPAPVITLQAGIAIVGATLFAYKLFQDYRTQKKEQAAREAAQAVQQTPDCVQKKEVIQSLSSGWSQFLNKLKEMRDRILHEREQRLKQIVDAAIEEDEREQEEFLAPFREQYDLNQELREAYETYLEEQKEEPDDSFNQPEEELTLYDYAYQERIKQLVATCSLDQYCNQIKTIDYNLAQQDPIIKHIFEKNGVTLCTINDKIFTIGPCGTAHLDELKNRLRKEREKAEHERAKKEIEAWLALLNRFRCNHSTKTIDPSFCGTLITPDHPILSCGTALFDQEDPEIVIPLDLKDLTNDGISACAKHGKNGVKIGKTSPEDRIKSRPDRRTDKSPYTYKYGEYKESNKHNPYSRNGASKNPIDGQRALDNSLPCEGNGKGRIAISEGEIIMLHFETTRKIKDAQGNEKEIPIYHGFVVDQGMLPARAKNVLIKHGLITPGGKIRK